jgi:hypothetical protein
MFTAAASLLACIPIGLAPAWRATAVYLTPALKDSSRSAEGGARLGLGKSLVVMQVALSLSLLIIAALFVLSRGAARVSCPGEARDRRRPADRHPARVRAVIHQRICKGAFMRRQLLVVLLLVVFSTGFGLTLVGAEAGAVNLTGTWGLQYMGTEGPIQMTFIFKQEGEKLSGAFSGVGPTPPMPGHRRSERE